MVRQIFEPLKLGPGKRPFVVAGLFLFVVFLFFFWGEFIAFADRHPLLRLIVSVEWAIARYQEGSTVLGLSPRRFFFAVLAQQVFIWAQWIVVFWKVSPWIGRQKKIRSFLAYLTLENQQKGFFAQRLSSLVLWSQRHTRAGKTLSYAFFFLFGLVSHGDIPAIGVAIGFRQWKALCVILAAMVCRVTFWSFQYLGYP